MASKDVVLEVDEPTTSFPHDELMFQEIPHTLGTTKTVQTHVFTNFPLQDDSDTEDKNELLENGNPKSQRSYLSFNFYQAFFDVDTRQVLRRVLGSIIPNRKGSYLHTHIRPNPDFYGPFWVSTTLIMSIAIAGNLVDYISAFGSSKELIWKFDFHKVSIATVAIYTYWLVMPFLAYLFLRWRGSREACLSELICLYGYSLSIYIPISWLFVMTGMTMSGFVLVYAIWPEIRNDKKQVVLVFVSMVSLMHCFLAIGFMLYFFSPSTTLAQYPIDSTTPVTSVSHSPTTGKAVQQVSAITIKING